MEVRWVLDFGLGSHTLGRVSLQTYSVVIYPVLKCVIGIDNILRDWILLCEAREFTVSVSIYKNSKPRDMPHSQKD